MNADDTNPLARAYELARSGKYAGITEITKQLKSEGFEGVDAHLAGAGIRRELTALARAAGAISTDGRGRRRRVGPE